jgi:acyl-coenzyme A synthetase/AMP-(fatty) acid ligase
MHAYPGSYAIGDGAAKVRSPIFRLPAPQQLAPMRCGFLSLAAERGRDRLRPIDRRAEAERKTWGSRRAALNAALLGVDGGAASIVATVPPQHMYGLEMSVLLPLRSRAAIHAGQPFFPADVAVALGETPAPRMLVTTPFHLRALLHDAIALPALHAIVTATAPLDAALAAEAERRFDAPVTEVFGSTETCVIAHRRTMRDEPWQLYAGIELQPQPDGTLVHAPHFVAPTLLQDIVELLPPHRFRLCGRNGDLLEIAGKRASLADLTCQLLSVDGVRDGVVFQLDADRRGLRRLAALVVAPDLNLTDAQILAQLRAAIDPIFLPRPLLRVDALPRNAAGKLPREALLAALATKA